MSKAIPQEIMRLEREQVRAVNRGDIAGAVRTFAGSFVGFSSTRHGRIRGLKALRRTFEYYLRRARKKISYRIDQPHVHVAGATAVATFYWTVGFGRGTRLLHGRGTHVFVRQGKDWRIIHEHFSRAH